MLTQFVLVALVPMLFVYSSSEQLDIGTDYAGSPLLERILEYTLREKLYANEDMQEYMDNALPASSENSGELSYLYDYLDKLLSEFINELDEDSDEYYKSLSNEEAETRPWNAEPDSNIQIIRTTTAETDAYIEGATTTDHWEYTTANALESTD